MEVIDCYREIVAKRLQIRDLVFERVGKILLLMSNTINKSEIIKSSLFPEKDKLKIMKQATIVQKCNYLFVIANNTNKQSVISA